MVKFMHGFVALCAISTVAVLGDDSNNEAHLEVPPELFDIKVNYLDGTPVDWDPLYNKKVFLFANVASQCGYTDSGYEQLNKLHDAYAKDGLVIFAIPCNQFGEQEPGSPAEIMDFATEKKGAKFKFLEKMDVNGPNTHDLYKFLKGEHFQDDGCKDTDKNCAQWADAGECEANPGYMLTSCALSCGECEPFYPFGGDVRWNFEYFLLDHFGDVIDRYKTGTDITSAGVRGEIRDALRDLEEFLRHNEDDDYYSEEDEKDEL